MFQSITACHVSEKSHFGPIRRCRMDIRTTSPSSQASATKEDMPRQQTPVPATNERPPRVTPSATAATSPASNLLHVSESVNLPRDRFPHKLPEFRLKDLVTDLDQYIASRQRKIDEEELCSTQRTFNPEEDVSDDTLKNLEVHDVTQVEDYLIETSDECEVFQIEPEIVIALNEGEDEMKIDVNSDKAEMLQIESEEDQPLVLVQPPTLLCTFGKPYKRVKVRERMHIFNVDTFVLDEPDTIDSFVLEVPNELLNMNKGVHASLPKYVDASFVVDISNGEGIT
ncbi:hypothetical protein Syun_031302 [Stephania yunnanensis]|uniref:Uncharacterized protein n=1 Tax=Stephania yunnanensis TaxID=152371 RepID=A0AAP0DZS8_9MAGN